jgi:hypothetical protein
MVLLIHELSLIEYICFGYIESHSYEARLVGLQMRSGEQLQNLYRSVS